ncbi:MAG: hypothetical protein R3180_03765, partial [Marinobacter sp.]|nr:hypothetical protein [Marinobacter sp.]
AITGLLSVFADLLREVTTSVVLAIVVGMLLWIAWMWEDWRNGGLLAEKADGHPSGLSRLPVPRQRR